MSELRLEYVSVSELVPYDKNPRKNDAAAEKVAELIKEYGFKKPILVDIKNNKNEIIAGHTRLKAALLLGIEKVPVIFADDLSPEQVKAFRIADNKSGEWAEWDIEMLNSELTDLRDVGFDIELTGFSDITLDGFAEMGEGSSIDVDTFLTDEDKPLKKPKLITCPRCGEQFAQYEVV
jgi:ParB-like chromosome segregation protein Spo0J